jgi:DNA invertase Pin-like site-specific DNA recombinase
MAGNLKRGHPPGENHPNARLTDAQVLSIRTQVAGGETQAKLAREFGVTPGTVSKLCSGQLRPNLPLTPFPRQKGSRHPRAKLTEEQAARIWDRLRQGEGTRALAREYGVSPGVIHRIKTGAAWKHVRVAQRRRKVWEG